MPITIVKDGNIFESKCKILVNPVNCVGVMGSGLAKQFKERFPFYFNQYKKECNLGWMHPGKVSLGSYDKNQLICSFPTKKHWKNKSELHWIASGLISLRARINILSKEDRSVAIPQLGAGLGGLNKYDVLNLVEETFKDSSIEVEYYFMS